MMFSKQTFPLSESGHLLTNLFKYLLFLVFFLFSLSQLYSQKFIQIEKNHLKTKLKYNTGDDIIFSLRNSDQWVRSAITEIDVEHKIIHMYGLTVPIDSIDAIRSYKPFVSPILGEILWKAGLASFISSALFGLVYQPENTLDFLIVTGSIGLTGLGMKQMAKIRRIYSIGKKFTIRPVDLNFYIQQSEKS